MSRKRRKNKNEETKRRFEALKDLMSTFAMSTVAVIAIVTLVPTSPKAEITKALALTDQIVYQVNVTDADSALDLDTLFVVLENQNEYYEKPISLGESSGYFDSLKSSTQYHLCVYGSKGFGQERLNSIIISTEEKTGGAILSVKNQENEFDETFYTVDVYINDPDMVYSSLSLYYGYVDEFNTELTYNQISITASRQQIELSDIYTSNPFHIYIEAVTSNDTIVLDEIWVTPPFTFYGGIYAESLHNTSIDFGIYSEMNTDMPVSYIINIYKNNRLIKTATVKLEAGNHYASTFTIGELLPLTTYRFEGIVSFINPLTLRKETQNIYEEELMTLDNYSYTYTIEHFDLYDEVTITLNDPSNQFNIAYFETYDTGGEFPVYIDGSSIWLESFDLVKAATLVIYLPTNTPYRITVGIRNETNYQIHEILYINDIE